jgi:hypothetical protein
MQGFNMKYLTSAKGKQAKGFHLIRWLLKMVAKTRSNPMGEIYFILMMQSKSRFVLPFTGNVKHSILTGHDHSKIHDTAFS